MKVEYQRDEESLMAEIEAMDIENGIIGVFQLPQPSLQEQILADNKYRQALINEQFNPPRLLRYKNHKV